MTASIYDEQILQARFGRGKQGMPVRLLIVDGHTQMTKEPYFHQDGPEFKTHQIFGDHIQFNGESYEILMDIDLTGWPKREPLITPENILSRRYDPKYHTRKPLPGKQDAWVMETNLDQYYFEIHAITPAALESYRKARARAILLDKDGSGEMDIVYRALDHEMVELEQIYRSQ